MMMEMLVAGGIPATDWTWREKGMEDARTASMGQAMLWVLNESGRCVKMLGLEPRTLPIGQKYRVIVMCRDFMEQAKSHHKMLSPSVRENREHAPLEEAAKNAMESLHRIAALLRLCEIPTLPVRYEEVVENPVPACEKLAEWLGLEEGAAERMASVVAKRDGACFDGFHERDQIGKATQEAGGIDPAKYVVTQGVMA